HDKELRRVGEGALRLLSLSLLQFLFSFEAVAGVIAGRDGGDVLLVPLETAPDDLGDGGDVVGMSVARGVPDLIAAVVGLLRQAVLENDEAGDDVRALDVRDVRALNSQGWLVHPEGLLQVAEG